MRKKRSPLKIGIIGAGRIGKIHSLNIQYRIPNATVKAIATLNPDNKPWLANFPDSLFFTDYRQLLAIDEIDAVIIASPSDQHVPQVIASAEAGKHIFCEKPVSFDIETYQSVIEATQKAEVLFQIGFNRQFDQSFLKLKQHILNGDIGDPHILRITSRDPKLPPFDYLQRSGGMLYDQTIHDFAIARFLVDSPVVEIYAEGDTLINPALQSINDIDTAVITLKFDNGCLGIIDNSRQAIYGYDQRIEIFGNCGSCYTNNKFPDDIQFFNQTNVSHSLPSYFFLERYQQSFLDEIKAFVDAVLTNHQPPVTGYDGIEALRLVKAAYQSIKHRRAIKLNKNNLLQTV